MILVIDIGNTFTKVAVFKQDELQHIVQYQALNTGIVKELLSDYQVDKAIISSVKKNGQQEWETFIAAEISLIYFDNSMTGKVINHYLTPNTLGLDRLAAVIGAAYLYPGQNSLIIDGGTCITYDWVDAGANYFGGSISPGLNMRYKALNYYTDGLPLIEADDAFAADYGNNTVTAIKSGVQNAIKYELTGFVDSYNKDGQKLNIVLCGGDSIFFDTLLKNSIFAPYIKIEPYLVLKGLNAAIQNNND